MIKWTRKQEITISKNKLNMAKKELEQHRYTKKNTDKEIKSVKKNIKFWKDVIKGTEHI